MNFSCYQKYLQQLARNFTKNFGVWILRGFLLNLLITSSFFCQTHPARQCTWPDAPCPPVYLASFKDLPLLNFSENFWCEEHQAARKRRVGDLQSLPGASPAVAAQSCWIRLTVAFLFQINAFMITAVMQ